nr:hypothetical protein [Tanacetum cinerariifolium]
MADVNVNAPADQQFWDSVRYDKTAGCYKFQLNEQWFELTKDTLRDALQITPVNYNKAFSSPSSSDALINFVNELGYRKLIRNLFNIVTNDMFQPWRALTTIINLCLTRKTSRKKKATLIVILSIRFTKLIIYHLQRKHKFHPRPDSPLYLPNEEPVLRYLKFSAKGPKRKVLKMPIPGNHITADIQGESYYQEYLAKVAKHQRYLADETGSDPDSPALKPTKSTKKSKPPAPKVALRPQVTKPASSQQTEPQPAPAKSQGKKRKLVTEISDKPSPTRKSKPGLVTKRHKPTSSLRSVDEFVAEGIPEKEPRVDDEEADGKGKEKVTEEQVTHDLLTLQTPKKKSSANQYIFQRFTSTPTGSSGHDESSSLYAELRLTDNEVESDEDVADVSIQPHPEKMNEGFTATAYPKVQENLKLTVEEQPIMKRQLQKPKLNQWCFTIQLDTSAIPPMTTPVVDLTLRPESPNVHRPLKVTATETTTTTTTIHPPPSQLQQSTTDSMLIQRIGKIKHIMANVIKENKHLEERLDSHEALDRAIQALLWNCFKDLPEADMKEILHQRMWKTNSYKTHEDHMMLYEALEKSMNRDHSEELLKDLVEARRKKKKIRPSRASGSPRASGSSQVPPPPPPHPSTNQEGSSPGSVEPSSSKTVASAEYQAWTTTDIRLRPSADLQIDDDMAPDAQAQLSDDEDIGNAYILKASALASTYSPPPEDLLFAHTSEGDRRAVRTHIRILSVVRIKVFSMYGYDYMNTIVFCRADLNEHIIAKRDFKYLYPSDFEDLYLLNLQSHLNHLPPKDKKILTTAVNLWSRHLVIRQRGEDFQLGIESYQTQLNLTKPRWDTTGFEYKHDYTVIDSLRAVTFWDRYGVRMIMRFNEIHKFSDGTLHQIDEALDYRVKEFKVNRMNPGLNTRFWTRKDVDRNKEFMFAIHKRLKTRRIFRNMESFVGGRVRDGDYRLLKRTE